MQPETQRHFPGNWIQRTTTHASPTRPPAPPDKTPLVTPAVTQQQPVVHVAKLSPPVGQFVIQTLLQIAGFGLAVAFGIYAVKSVTVGTIANDYGDKSVQQAIVSNQLAMLAICLSMTNQTDAVSSICNRIVDGADSILPTVAAALFTSLPPENTAQTTTGTSTGTGGSASPTSSSSQDAGQDSSNSSSSGPPVFIIIAGVVGGLLALTTGLSIMFCLLRRSHKRAALNDAERIALDMKLGIERPHQAARASGGDYGISGAAMRLGQRFRDTFIDSRVSSGP